MILQNILFLSVLLFKGVAGGVVGLAAKHEYLGRWSSQWSSLFYAFEQEEQSLHCTASCNGQELSEIEQGDCNHHFIMYCSFGTVEYNGYIQSACFGKFVRKNVRVLDFILEAAVYCDGFWHSYMNSKISSNAVSNVFLTEEFMCSGKLTIFKSGQTMREQVLTGRTASYVCEGAQGITYIINDDPKNPQQQYQQQQQQQKQQQQQYQQYQSQKSNLQENIKDNVRNYGNKNVSNYGDVDHVNRGIGIDSIQNYKFLNNYGKDSIFSNYGYVGSVDNVHNDNKSHDYSKFLGKFNEQSILSKNNNNNSNNKGNFEENNKFIDNSIAGVSSNTENKKQNQQNLRKISIHNFDSISNDLESRRHEIAKISTQNLSTDGITQIQQSFFKKYNKLLPKTNNNIQNSEFFINHKKRKLQGITGNLGVYLKYLQIEDLYESFENYTCEALCNNKNISSKQYLKCKQIYNISCTAENPPVAINLSCLGYFEGDLQDEACIGKYNFKSNNKLYLIVDTCSRIFGGKYTRQEENDLAIEEICQGVSSLEVQNLNKYLGEINEQK